MKHELTAKRLMKALSNANLKPHELATLSGVSKASISQYINGSHKPSNLSSGKMADYLGVNPMWLMGFDVPMNYGNTEALSLYEDKSPPHELSEEEVETEKLRSDLLSAVSRLSDEQKSALLAIVKSMLPK